MAGGTSAAVGSAWEESLVSRTIFHVDVNSAFLSWSALEQLKEKPGSVDLRTIPSAVGGDVQTRHGIITAKSIPAKAYHIQTGEPVVRALEKCPQLVLVRTIIPFLDHRNAGLLGLVGVLDCSVRINF